MLKFINLKKLTSKTLIGILVTGSFIAGTSDKKAIASNACSNNGHGNNAPVSYRIGSGILTIGDYDRGNDRGKGSAGKALIADLVAGKISKSNGNYKINYTGASSYSLTTAQATKLVENHPDWEIKGNGKNATTTIEECSGNDRDQDSINDAVELGSNFNLPLDSDGDGNPNYEDTDSDNDGINDEDENSGDSDGDGVINYLDNTNNKHNSKVNDDVYGLELRYLNSAFQCGSNPTQADIKVQVYDKNNNLLTTLSKNQTYKSSSIDSIADLRFKYKMYNVSCQPDGTLFDTAKGVKLLGPSDTVPSVGGFEDQASIREMVRDLNSYEELYLAELGTNDRTSTAYDLQDVVLVVNNNPLPPNLPPLANNDVASTPYGASITVNVLANDKDPDGPTPTINSVNSSTGANVEIVNSQVRYTPKSNFNTAGGDDSFTYTIKDNRGATSSATVTVTVNIGQQQQPNRPPSAVDDTDITPYGTPVTIDVMGNDIDPDDNDSFSITNVTSSTGATVQIVDGKVQYTPKTDFNTDGGDDSFTYTITDSESETDSATVTVTVKPKETVAPPPKVESGGLLPD
jgi:hypothetical protein